MAVDTVNQLFVYNFQTYEKEYDKTFSARLTCITVSRDSRHLLISVASGEVQLLDLETGDLVRTFKGQQQGNFIIRSCFGGAAENFVLSGSEGKLMIIPACRQV